ncbi:MAG: peptidylprolyl isomerase [Dehalococcoidia bacterium]|nr:peptidylprolyl isomerase [Dehalococcoidia bacterium]
MANKKQQRPSRTAPTRRQLSRWQRENRSRRITLAVGSFIILVVIALVGFGAYTKYVVPPRETAFKVNGTAFDMEYYVKVLRWLTFNGRALQAATPDAMAQTIVEPELLRQAAPGLQISVTSDEALDVMREPYRSTLTQGEEFNESKFQDWYRLRLKDYGLSADDVGRFLEQTAIRNKLRDYLGKDLPAFATQVRLLGIEVSDVLTANDVQTKLAQGQDFAEVAKASSIDGTSGANGGELGWFVRDLLPPEIADTVFALQPGAVTQPISGRLNEFDTSGFWIFKVVEKQENREVDPAAQNALKNKLATQWFDEQKAKSQIENMVTNEKRAWALEQAPAQ